VVGYPPLVEVDDGQRREFHEALLDADVDRALISLGLSPPNSQADPKLQR
jgi:hypothetical protein